MTWARRACYRGRCDDWPVCFLTSSIIRLTSMGFGSTSITLSGRPLRSIALESPLMTITGTLARCVCSGMWDKNANPSMTGIARSSRIKAGVTPVASTDSSACIPFSAGSTEYPAPSRISRKASLVPVSSSTSRIVARPPSTVRFGL